jgi:1-acyl-sn-glycerol-3-phosphate acyltransferase
MTLWLRSFVFNGAFYGWTFLCGIIFVPSLLFPRHWVLAISKFWICGVVWICEHILGLHTKVIGEERFAMSPAIFAFKHQSAWETLYCYDFLADPAIVLKRELLWIPFFGWYLKKLQMIPLSRSKQGGLRDLKTLLKEADRAVAEGRPVVIFPEGTRSIPGKPVTYHSGIASLYLHLQIPVVPVAHDAGLYWPRRGFLKHPGCVTLELLEPIEPGLSKQAFMRTLEERIETKMTELIAKGPRPC